MKKYLIIKTDGGARGNPGPAAIGIVAADEEGNELFRFRQKIGKTTNNVAEYQAVVKALKILTEKKDLLAEISGLRFFLDSSLVVNQLNGIFKIKESHLWSLVEEVRTLEREICKEVSFHQIPREENKIADKLVNEALDI